MGEDVNAMICRLYTEKLQSTSQIAARTGISQSGVRSRLLKNGITLRSRKEALQVREGLGAHLTGVKRTFTPEWKLNISRARKKWSEQNALGVSRKSCGYVVVTRGPDKDRGEHCLIMEKRLGRKLLPDEVVHHIDRDRSNNAENNLALVTRSGHTRLHRFEDSLQQIERRRSNGRFS